MDKPRKQYRDNQTQYSFRQKERHKSKENSRSPPRNQREIDIKKSTGDTKINQNDPQYHTEVCCLEPTGKNTKMGDQYMDELTAKLMSLKRDPEDTEDATVESDIRSHHPEDNFRKDIPSAIQKSRYFARRQSHSIDVIGTDANASLFQSENQNITDAKDDVISLKGSGRFRARRHSVQLVPSDTKLDTDDRYDPDKQSGNVAFRQSGDRNFKNRLGIDGFPSASNLKRNASSLINLREEDVPRIIFVGDKFVGKTSIINRFTTGLLVVNSGPVATPIVKHTKYVYYASIDKEVRVQFWDIEGGEVPTAIESSLRAHAVVVVFDLTSRSSFDKAQFLLDNINPRVTAMLVGNKLDIRTLRKVSYKEGKLLAKIHRVQYVETSAKHNYNIDEALQLLLAGIPKEYLIRRTPFLKERASSDSHVSDVNLCTVCQKNLVRHDSKDEIDI